ncbi:type II secretion system F family protein [Pontibacterium sp.]|jgi:tight adherence protein C|uniref:type II secretion system F family protein n=1 Tax=Pontibacterium sp. TaxID=2036026 RepID=UPI003569A606
MEFLLDLINEYLQNESYSRMVFVGMAAAAALAFAFSVIVLVSSLSSPFEGRKRVLTKSNGLHSGDHSNRVMDSLDPLTKLIVPKQNKHTFEVRLKLMHAGFRSDNAVKNFYAIKILLVVTIFFAVVLSASFLPEVTARQIFVYAALGALTGFLLPSMVLDRLALNRIKTIHSSFPDALDLLVVCIESGLGLSAALQRVAQELDVSHPELAEELNLVNSEIRAGVHRIDALKNMAERTGVDDIKGLVALLDQSMRFGGSIADTLRVYSEEFRDKRMQRAEELAAKIGTKMIFPLTFCLWPGFFLVAVGPAVLTVLEVFGR